MSRDPYLDIPAGTYIISPDGGRWYSAGSGHMIHEIVQGAGPHENQWCGIIDAHTDKRDNTKRCSGYVAFEGFDREKPIWKKTGDTFETLTLSPSIHCDEAKHGCGSHGYIENGKWREC